MHDSGFSPGSHTCPRMQVEQHTWHTELLTAFGLFLFWFLDLLLIWSLLWCSLASDSLRLTFNSSSSCVTSLVLRSQIMCHLVYTVLGIEPRTSYILSLYLPLTLERIWHLRAGCGGACFLIPTLSTSGSQPSQCCDPLIISHVWRSLITKLFCCYFLSIILL